MTTPGVPAPSEELIAAAMARYADAVPPPLSVEQERLLTSLFDPAAR